MIAWFVLLVAVDVFLCALLLFVVVVEFYTRLRTHRRAKAFNLPLHEGTGYPHITKEKYRDWYGTLSFTSFTRHAFYSALALGLKLYLTSAIIMLKALLEFCYHVYYRAHQKRNKE